MANQGKNLDVQIQKVDADLGLVFGYAIVCKNGGEEYFDLQGDHIPEQAMLESTFAYMSGSRVAKDSHQGDAIGQVVYGFPLTDEISKSLGITVEKTGFVIGMRPRSDIMEKFASGEYTGFSIGGRGERTEVE